MNRNTKKLIKTWIDALRSGEYKQCRGVLIYNGCFCANGVLLNIIDKKAWNGSAWRSFSGKYMYSSDVNRELIKENISFEHISVLNDKLKLSFNEIADEIEARLDS